MTTGNLDQRQLRATAAQTTIRPKDWPRITSVPDEYLHLLDGDSGCKNIRHADLALQTSGGRMRWRNVWAEGNTYDINDTVRDGYWSAVANTQTTTRPAPQPTGDPFWVSGQGQSPTWATGQSNTSSLLVGQRYRLPQAGFLTGARVWIPVISADYEYRWVLVQNPTVPPPIIEISPILNPTATGWFSADIAPIIVTSGAEFDFMLNIRYVGSSTTYQFNYDYVTPPQSSIPAAGNIQHPNAATWELHIAKTDADAVDRSAVLAQLKYGDQIELGDSVWQVLAVSDQTSYVIVDVTPNVQNQTDGLFAVTFKIRGAAVIDYQQIVDHWVSNADVDGLISTSGIGNETVTDNLYGADISVQPAAISGDWDILSVSTDAISGGGSGGLGGSGTIDTVPKFTASAVLGDSNLTDDGTAVASGIQLWTPETHVGKGGWPNVWFWHPDYPTNEDYRLRLLLQAGTTGAHPSLQVYGPQRAAPTAAKVAYIQFDEQFIGIPVTSTPGGGSPPSWTPQNLASAKSALVWDYTTSTLWAYYQAQWHAIAGGGGGGAVDSVFGRTGVVVAQLGDYTAALISFSGGTSGLSATQVQGAIDELAGIVSLNTASRHSHANKAILDSISNAGSGLIITTAERTAITDNTTARHTHSNKSVLDGVRGDLGATVYLDGTGNYSTPEGGSGIAGVTSWKGRAGDVLPLASDYDANQVDFTPGGTISSTDVQGAIEDLEPVVAANATARHTHANKPVLDAITAAGSGSIITATERTNVTNNTAARHTHSNKALLDTLTSAGAGNQVLTDDGTYKPINISLSFVAFTFGPPAVGSTQLIAHNQTGAVSVIGASITLSAGTAIGGWKAGDKISVIGKVTWTGTVADLFEIGVDGTNIIVTRNADPGGLINQSTGAFLELPDARLDSSIMEIILSVAPASAF